MEEPGRGQDTDPFCEVDAITSCPAGSRRKNGNMALTRSAKLRKLSPTTGGVPAVKRHPFAWNGTVAPVDGKAALRNMRSTVVCEVDWIVPGERQRGPLCGNSSFASLLGMTKQGTILPDGQSDLSPYLHFASCPHSVGMEVMKAGVPERSGGIFEELIRGASCRTTSAFTVLRMIRSPFGMGAGDPENHLMTRVSITTRCTARRGQTHDDLWNAAQREMVIRGKMHGYLRMYWARRSWNEPDTERAMKAVIFLNDNISWTQDPNGYAGIAGASRRSRPSLGERKIFAWCGT